MSTAPDALFSKLVALAPEVQFRPATRPEVVEDVLALGPAGTLDRIREERRLQDEAAARELRAVTHWADQHRTDRVGAADPEMHSRWQGEPALGIERELRLAGEGAFTVEEFAVTEVAAALGMSEPAARAYVGQALELRERLPRLWARVMVGELAPWKGRRVAQETIPLAASVADAVDADLAAFAGKMSLRRILRSVQASILRHDPEAARERAAEAANGRGVWLEEHLDGCARITAVTSAPDAAAFDEAVGSLASTLAALGDTDVEQVRRSKAVGLLADPQQTLELQAAATDIEAGADAADRLRRIRPRSGPTFHLHLHTDAVHGALAEGHDARGAVVRTSGFGPQHLRAVDQWLRDLAPGARIHLTPVVDLTEAVAVDAYEVPVRLRRQIEHRDASCRFPWCGREGRHDLDHIRPYDPDGPPGQTSSHNLARLCRFHHRVKTHGEWTYRRRPDGTLEWTSPIGRSYTVDDTGTYPHP